MDKTVTIAGTRIDNTTLEETLSTVAGWIESRDTPRYIVTPNVDHIVKLQCDNEFRDVYRDADMVLADGMPLLWAARFFGTPLRGKISGSDLFIEICKVAASRKFRLFFLGGNPGDAEKAKENLTRQNPGLLVVGCYCPPFGFERDQREKEKIIDVIKSAAPDVLFVGLGAPKQEKWIYEFYQQVAVPVTIGVGVSFSFAAGTVKRAPVWMQKRGLEWFWRLMMEPRRLWRRYLVEDMKFFWLVLRQRFLHRSCSSPSRE